jgi:hypothetical protein
MLNKSVDNTLATVENWSRAIQFRDGLGHIFRGEASFSPQLYAGFIKNLGGSLIPTKSTTRQGGQRKAPAATAPAPAAAPPAQPARPQPITQQALDNLLDGVGKTQKDVQQLLDNLTKKPLLPGGQPLLGTRDDGQVALPLLDYLLGR